MIIPAEGFEAIFKTKVNDVEGETNRPVIAWQENPDGSVEGLVVDNDSKSLTSANAFPNFHRYERILDQSKLVIAQPGWYVRYHDDEDDANSFNSPVIAWMAEVNGYGLKPITQPDRDGYNEPSELSEGDEHHAKVELIYSPNEDISEP